MKITLFILSGEGIEMTAEKIRPSKSVEKPKARA
jgi:hypothetical protein